MRFTADNPCLTFACANQVSVTTLIQAVKLPPTPLTRLPFKFGVFASVNCISLTTLYVQKVIRKIQQSNSLSISEYINFIEHKSILVNSVIYFIFHFQDYHYYLFFFFLQAKYNCELVKTKKYEG